MYTYTYTYTLRRFHHSRAVLFFCIPVSITSDINIKNDGLKGYE